MSPRLMVNAVTNKLEVNAITNKLMVNFPDFGSIVQFGQATEYSSSNITIFSASLPAPATAGTTLLALMVPDKDSGAITVPTGFTQVTQVQNPSISFGLFYKIAVGGEQQVDFDWVTGVRGHSALLVEILGNYTPDTFSTGSSANVAVNTLSTSSATPTTFNSFAFCCVMVDSASNFGTPTWTNNFTAFAQYENVDPNSFASGYSACLNLLDNKDVQESTCTWTDTGDQALAIMAIFKGT